MGEPVMACTTEKKIDGFDKWEVEGAASTLIEAKEITKRPKFYKTVLKEVDKQIKAAQAVALEAKVGKQLKKTYGNPRPHKNKKKGY